MAITNFVKRIQDVMRNDAGVNGDAQRIEQIVWILFLKIYDAKEEEWELVNEEYFSIIPEECKWRNWAVDNKDGEALTGDAILNYVNNTLFPTLKNLEIDDVTPMNQVIVKYAFEDANNYMKDGVLLRQVVNIIDEIDFTEYEERHAFGTIYESFLKDLQSAGNAGEFYTPRAVTDFMVEVIKPKLGEKVADFACGTGGFLVSALNAFEKQVGNSLENREIYNNSIYGVEKKALPHILCVTNMLLHDIDNPDIISGIGAIKKTGLYGDILSVLNDAGVEVAEFQGVEPNPQYSTVNRAAELCKKSKCDVVIAVGGGSVIDASKVIAQANYYDGDCWDLVTQKVKEDQALPLITIVTIASAGSENDAWAVISNADENVKLDPWNKNYQPTVSFVNPEITYTVDAYQTAVGAADTLSHITDCRYFIKEHKIEFVNEMMEVMAANVIKYAPIAIEDPTNYEARENLSWIATMITGGIMDVGGKTDMVLHLTEYGIAAFYEIPHGHGIAILMPRWMEYVLNEKTAPDFYRFGVKCFNVDSSLDAMDGAKQTIDALSDWLYNTLKLESRLSEFGVTEDRLHDMAAKACERTGGTLNSITTLTVEDVENIFRLCL